MKLVSAFTAPKPNCVGVYRFEAALAVRPTVRTRVEVATMRVTILETLFAVLRCEDLFLLKIIMFQRWQTRNKTAPTQCQQTLKSRREFGRRWLRDDSGHSGRLDQGLVKSETLPYPVARGRYSATQSTYMVTGTVGHWRPSAHIARCSKSRRIGMWGTSLVTCTLVHTLPSTV